MADKDLVKLLSTPNFDPNNYVQSLSRQTDGAAETFTATRDQVSSLYEQICTTVEFTKVEISFMMFNNSAVLYFLDSIL